jgi:hypothetical protein
MKDIYNIVKVSDIDDIDLRKIINKCNETPNLISYYYPHIFMNRDKINKDELKTLIETFTNNIKRDKNVDHTLKKYNIISNIIETLFLCIYDLNTIKNFQRYIQLNISSNENILTDILNSVIQNKPLNNLELILNNKIDISNCVFIIEKIIEHIKKDYTDPCLEKQVLTQYQLICHIQKYTAKYKYNPFLLKILNMNKFYILNDYIKNCTIGESHDTYLGNIYEIYENINKSDDIADQQYDWNVYINKINESLKIEDPKEKIKKSILRISFLDKIVSLQKNPNYKNPLILTLTNLIENNKIDKIMINTFINMIKTNAPIAKLEVIENIIKYFNNFGNLSKELIKLIFPKYFAKEDIKYYENIIQRINVNLPSGKKLLIIDNIISDQVKYENTMKHATIKNSSNVPFEISKLSTFCIDNRFSDINCEIKQTDYALELIGYAKFTKLLFEMEIFKNLKTVAVHNYLSNGVVEIGNTTITTNMILLNVLFMFNNSSKSVAVQKLKDVYKDEVLVNDIIHTLEYYNIIKKNDETKSNSNILSFIYKATEVINLNTTFFDKKQEIKIELIKKVIEAPVVKDNNEKKVDTTIVESSRYDVIECFILKTIKPTKVNKNDLQKLVESKCKFSISLDGFNKCMKRLYDLNYFEYQNEEIVYVP